MDNIDITTTTFATATTAYAIAAAAATTASVAATVEAKTAATKATAARQALETSAEAFQAAAKAAWQRPLPGNLVEVTRQGELLEAAMAARATAKAAASVAKAAAAAVWKWRTSFGRPSRTSWRNEGIPHLPSGRWGPFLFCSIAFIFRLILPM